MAEGEAQAGYIAELVVQIYDIHEVVIEESGGLEGLRDGVMLHESRGYVIPQNLPKDEVICFCLDIAEENIRRAQDESVQAKTTGEIALGFIISSNLHNKKLSEP